MDPALPAAAPLATDAAGDLLAVAIGTAGVELARWRLRTVEHGPGRAVSCVYEATLAGTRAQLGLPVDAEGGLEPDAPAVREVLLVAHVSSRPVPAGAVRLETAAGEVHVWRFPEDPYLPGLPSAISPARVRELLDALGAPAGRVRLTTPSYRPSRRAVVRVEVAGATDAAAVLYLKLVGGADADQVARRATRLADAHARLVGHVPAPAVVGTAARQGIVALRAVTGTTLRASLLAGEVPVDPADLVAMSTALADAPVREHDGPRRYADPRRHVDVLARHLPERADELRRLADLAADVDGPEVGVHGDLHDGQVLHDAAGAITGLLDVDGAGRGLQAQDLGWLVAHVEAAGHVDGTVADAAEAYAARLVEAAVPVVGATPLARAAAGAWLALATGPYRAQEPGWEQETAARVDRAAAWLARGAT
ncbi:MAG: phosphotransferase [Actinomycetes bacterium]